MKGLSQSCEYDMTPLVKNWCITVNTCHFYSPWCYMFGIVVNQLMLLTKHLPNLRDISQNIDHGRRQHIAEGVCGGWWWSARPHGHYHHGTG
jgi:hypothetical protein